MSEERKTTVLHIKHWNKNNPEHIYIGRAGNNGDGYFGNPYAKGRVCQDCGELHADGGSTLACYEHWLQQKLAYDEQFAARVAQLHGKTLICFCKPNPCHGEVLAKYAAQLQE